MNPEYITITLYKLKPNAAKIQAIKMVRAMGCLYGGKIGLKDAKHAVDNIDSPRRSRCASRLTTSRSSSCGIEAHFVTANCEPEPMWLDSIVDVPDAGVRCRAVGLTRDYSTAGATRWTCDSDGIPF